MPAALLALAALLAQDADPARLVEALGADAPLERETAAAALERLGQDAVPALRLAAASSNPEIAGRAAELLRRARALALSTLVVERVDAPFAPFGRADHFRVVAGGKLAVGHDLEDVLVWSLPEGRCVAAWRPHPRGVRDFALAPDGSRVLTWGHRGLALWELPAGRLVRRFDSVISVPRAFVVSPDGRRVGWTTWDGLEWIEADTGRTVWTREPEGLRTPVALGLSADGRRLATVGANSRSIELLDARTGALIRSFEAPTTGFRSRIAYTKDGRGVVVTNPDHRKAWVFSVESGEQEREAEDAEFDVLAAGSPRVRVVHPRDEKDYPGWTIVRPPLQPYPDSPDCWFLSGDERVVVLRTLNGRTAHVHDAKTGERLREVGADLASIAPSPDGVLAGTRSGEAVLYGFDGAEKARVRGGKGRVEQVASAGPGRVLWRDGEGVLRCSELASGRELWRREFFTLGSFAFALSPDGRHAVGDASDPGQGTGRLVRFDLASGRELGRYADFKGYLAGVAFSADGACLAASTRDGPLAVWESESRRKLWERSPGKNARRLAFTPDSASLLAGDDEGRLVRLAARTGEEERVYLEKGGRIRGGALSPDGRSLAVLTEPGGLALFDAAGGAPTARLEAVGLGGLGFRDGGVVLASAEGVRLVGAGGEVRPLGKPGRLRWAAVDGTRTRLGVLLEDGRFAAIDLADRKPVWEMTAPEGTRSFALGPRAEVAVFHGERGTWVKVLRPGSDVPEAMLEKCIWMGWDPGRAALYTMEGDRLQRRDFRTLAVKAEAPRRQVLAVLPCGAAPWLLAFSRNRWFRLDAETLELLDELPVPGNLSYVDADLGGDLLLMDDAFRDARTGRIRAVLPAPPDAQRFFRFFDAAGGRIHLVTPEAKLVTLGPRP
jgi:WD40 repeat protein